MTTPTGSNQPHPVSPSGFMDVLRESGRNFTKISVTEKLITLGASLLTLPLFVVGGVVTFIACSNYFASKNVRNITPDQKPESPSQRTDKAFKNVFTPELSKMDLMASQLMDLDDQVDRFDFMDAKAFDNLFNIGSEVENQKNALQKLDRKSKMAKELNGYIQTLEVKLKEAQEILLEKPVVETKTDPVKMPKPLPTPPVKAPELLMASRLKDLDQLVDELDVKGGDALDTLFQIGEAVENEKNALARLGTLKNPEWTKQLKATIQSLEAKLSEAQEALINHADVESIEEPLVTDQVTKKQKIEGGAVKGVPNIGNSCYLNSTMQVLIGNPAFKEKIMNPVWPGIEALKDEFAARAANSGHFEMLDRFDDIFIRFEDNFNKGNKTGIVFSANKEEQNLLTEMYRDFGKAKNLQAAAQNFVNQLDASRNPSEARAAAIALRSTLFAAGVFGKEDLYEQQDASQLFEYLASMVGITTAYETTREIPTVKRDEKLEQLGVLPIAINKKSPNETVYAQNLVDEFFKTKVSNTSWRVEGTDYPQHNETVSLGNKPPQEVVLQLKRFVGGRLEQNKIKDPILFPKDHILDLSQGFKGEEARYRVTGAIHHGGEVGGGHYRAFTSKNGEWLQANDSVVTKVKDIDQWLSESYIIILEKI